MPKRLLLDVLGPDTRVEPVTVLPPLSRWLARHAPRLYARLARLRPLLSHWLASYRRSPAAPDPTMAPPDDRPH